jgi:Autotransporter beta-domain
VFSCRSLSSAGAALAAALALTTGQALASAGCDAVNAGGFNGGTSNDTVYTTIAGFAVGDRITFSINIPGSASWTLGAGTNSSNLDNAGATSIHSYTVTGNQIAGQSDTTLTQARISPTVLEPLSVTATCTPAASNSNTDSQKLRALQIAASKLVAQTSGAAITGAIDGAIGDAFNGGGNPVSFGPSGMTFNFTAAPRSDVAQRADQAFAALGYGAMPSKALPKQVIENDWSAWADVRGTGWDRNTTSADLKGDQINVTAGLGRKLTPDLLIGLVTGYENFKYNSTLLAGTFKGDGWTIGGYGAWRFAPHWRFDAALAWSDISYDAVAGTAAGTFNGHRWLASSGLTGRYRFDALIVEPSSKVYALWERQNQWTDSLGTLQAARNFSAGRLASGGKVSYPWLTGDWTVAPYVGLYGDWRFSTDDALPAGQPLVGIGDGWSARLTGGVTMAKAGGAAVSLGGEYGGLGANYKVWSASGLVSWPF